MRCFRKMWILLTVLLALSLASCSSVKKTQVKNAVNEAHQSLEAGDLQKALDRCQSAYQRYPKDSEVLKHYVEIIESVRTRGDKAFDRNSFLQAQIIYELLLEDFSRFSKFANLLSFNEPFLVLRIKSSRMHHAEKQAQYSLRTRDFQGGMDIYKNLVQQYPSDKAARNRYRSVLESIKSQADLDFERKDFVLAGRTYKILLSNYSSLNHFKRFVSFDAGFLEERLQACLKILFENGLEQYRSGDLNRAISTWKSILTFDPENVEVKKATDRAISQSKKLKRIMQEEDK